MVSPASQVLKAKLLTDDAEKAEILDMDRQPWIAGFATDPSFPKRASVRDCESYDRDLVPAGHGRNISFEGFSNDIPETIDQAHVIASCGKNVYFQSR